MRSDALFFFATVALVGCGGNWSNEDLEFLNALPVRGDLELKIPERGTTSGGLTVARQGLGGLGEEPKLYTDSRTTSRNANQGVFGLLEVIEKVRLQPPTTRGQNRRVWGPVPDERQPGFDVRVVMTREETAYAWSIEFRPSGVSDEAAWFRFVDGHARSSDGGVRRASGTIRVDVLGAREAGLKAGEGREMNAIEIAYDTAADPVAVHIDFTAESASVAYAYEQSSSGQGAFRFELEGDLIPARPGNETIRVDAAWLPSGAGRAEARLEDLPGYENHRQVECWDAEFRAVYLRNDFRAGDPQGDETKCPAP